MSKKKVIIIGSGIGGLGTACILGQAGYDVEVFEKNSWHGGRAGLITVKKQKDGTWGEDASPRSKQSFKFDTGPSWYLMPDIFEHFYKLIGEDVHDQLDLKRLSPSYQVMFKDTFLGSTKIYGDLKKDGPTLESIEPGAHNRMITYLEQSSHQYNIAISQFLYKNYDSILDFFSLKMMRDGLRLNVFSSMQSYVSKRFSSPEIQKILQYPLVFLGASPKNAPALYNIMSHIDFKQGVFYPMGGIYSVTKSLILLAEKSGTKLHLNTEVERIVTSENRATGVIVDGKLHEADVVISNADIHYTETKLLHPIDRQYSKRYWDSRTLAPSALLLYLGAKGTFPHLEHHNLLFSKNWDANFKSIFGGKKFPKDPSMYVCNPNKTDPTVAPKGHENLFVLVPIAPGVHYNDVQLESFIDQTLETLETSMHMTNLREKIVYKKSFCVNDFETTYNTFKGSALGLAHTLRQTAIFRPRNQHKNIHNLLYVGANTVPGIGLPMCLISAELAYKRIVNDTSCEPIKTLIS